MDWGKVFQIATTCIASIGGIGAVIIGCLKFGSDIIADKLSRKYQLKLDSEIEKLKAELNKKEYVSKTRFDAEFSIYRELSSAFSELNKNISIMIPLGHEYVSSSEEKKKEYEHNCYLKSNEAYVIAQDSLFANIAFIPERFYELYNELLIISRKQLSAFERRYNAGYLISQKEKDVLSPEDYDRTDELNKKWQALNKEIRNYLSKLDVVD